MSDYQKEWYIANKERLSAVRKEKYAQNKEKILAKSKAYYEANKEKKAESVKKWQENNPEKVKLASDKWRTSNKKKCCELTTKWKKENPEKVRKAKKTQYERYKNDPAFVISGSISNALRYSLGKGIKANKKLEEMVDFTVAQLKKHLEKQFRSGMSWENYGSFWHIDHKIPIKAFNFTSPDHIDFKRCWALENLQPLEAVKNMSKGARLERPFQPSLAM